jgi:hypothetical protein
VDSGLQPTRGPVSFVCLFSIREFTAIPDVKLELCIGLGGVETVREQLVFPELLYV